MEFKQVTKCPQLTKSGYMIDYPYKKILPLAGKFRPT